MNGSPDLYKILKDLNVEFEYIEHPPAPTVEIAKQYWEGHDAQHCKNLLFRNHKGNRHYLVILNCDCSLNVQSLEKLLNQGKLSFASEKRMLKYLGVTPGSVTPFGLINDTEHHVYVFLDKNLQQAQRLSFHPCVNTASLLIAKDDFLKFMSFVQNPYEWIELY